jgi:hypothetical protein
LWLLSSLFLLAIAGCEAAPEPPDGGTPWLVDDDASDGGGESGADLPDDATTLDDAVAGDAGTVDTPDAGGTGDIGLPGDATASDDGFGDDDALSDDAGDDDTLSDDAGDDDSDDDAVEDDATDDDAADGGDITVTCKTDNDCPDIDASLCTQEACAAGVCVVLPTDGPLCDDGNACTEDLCEPDTGCVALPAAATCDDGDLCTATGTCSDGACLAGVPVDCDDGNLCTDAFCEAATGDCKYPAITQPTPCDDGTACTLADACKYGSCQGAPRLWQQTWGDAGSNDTAAAVAHHKGSQRFAVAGRTPLVGGFVRTHEADGGLVFTQYFGFDILDVVAIDPPEPNGAHFLVVGTEPNPLGGGLRGFLAKIDKDGKQVLNTKQPLQDGLPRAVAPHPSGGWLIAGMAAKSASAWFAAVNPAGYVTKTGSAGGAVPEQFDAFLDVVTLPGDAGFALAGTRHIGADDGGEPPLGGEPAPPLDGQAWLRVVDKAGTLIFEATWGGPGHDDARAVLALPGGDVLVGSTLASDGQSGATSVGTLRRYSPTGALLVETPLAALDVLSVDGLTGLDPQLAAGAHAMAAVTVQLPAVAPNVPRDAAVMRLDALTQPMALARLGSAPDDDQRATDAVAISPDVEVVVGQSRSQGDPSGDVLVATVDIWGNTECAEGCLALAGEGNQSPGGGGPQPKGGPIPPPGPAPCDDGDPCTFDVCLPATATCASSPAPVGFCAF